MLALLAGAPEQEALRCHELRHLRLHLFIEAEYAGEEEVLNDINEECLLKAKENSLNPAL